MEGKDIRRGRTRRSVRLFLVVSVGLILATFAMVPVPARASDSVRWQLAFSGKCGASSPCGGFSTVQGACALVGTATSGDLAHCVLSFSETLGVATEYVNGTAWDIEASPLSPAGPGANDFFITDGTVTFAGAPVAFLVMSAGPFPGCTATGGTLTCPIPVAEAFGLYAPDTLAPVDVGHFSAGVCFGTGVADPGCRYIQQLTLVG